MNPSEYHVSPLLYIIPGRCLVAPGTYLEVETERKVNVIKLPVSGMYIMHYPRSEGERITGYLAQDRDHHYHGPLLAA